MSLLIIIFAFVFVVLVVSTISVVFKICMDDVESKNLNKKSTINKP